MDDRALALFKHGLRDMYDAETRLVDALQRMAKDATDDTLANGFRDHLKVTREHVKRLEKVFRTLDLKPRGTPCHGIRGLIEEYRSYVRDEDPDPETLDLFAATAALKVEHYEIAAYQALSELAGMLGMGQAAVLLGKTLVDETATAGKLTAAATKLGAQLTGTTPGGAIRQVSEGLKEGALVAVGAADVVRERAVEAAENVAGAAAELADRAEKRGRKVVRGTSRRSKGSSSRSSSAPKRTSPAKKKTTGSSKRSTRKTTGSSSKRGSGR